jgi:CDP-diacylglycerol--glycerol-3-phosphate 3-phosphatidyltransferase
MATMTPPRHPPVFNLANQLTAMRLALAIVLFVLIGLESWVASIIVFAVAAFTDWLDGYLARKHGLSSAVGRMFDPLVDKVLMCGAYIFLLPVDGAGLAAWMVTVVVGRELIITGLRSFMEQQGTSFGADWLGKIKMGLQCAALFAIFVALALRGPEQPDGVWFFERVRDGLVYAMVAATALSGLQYLWRATTLLTV